MHAVSEVRKLEKHERAEKEERAKQSDCKAGRQALASGSQYCSEWYSEV